MWLKKPHLKDSLLTQVCLLCDQAFCINHKKKKKSVCKINHETYYCNHSAAQNYLYQTYENYERDYKQMMVNETSKNERKVVVEQKENDEKAKMRAAKKNQQTDE